MNNPISFIDPSGHQRDCSTEVCQYTGPKIELPPQVEYDGDNAGRWALENWETYPAICEGYSCTEFVSAALVEGGLPEEEGRWEKYLTVDACGVPDSPWGSTSALYDYLTNDLGYKAIEVDLNNLADFFIHNIIPAGSPVFYDNGNFVDDSFPSNSFGHAAITTGNSTTYNGITGPEVANHNGGIANPHLLSQTSEPVVRIFIVLIGD